jgi:hypothetical protein
MWHERLAKWYAAAFGLAMDTEDPTKRLETVFSLSEELFMARASRDQHDLQRLRGHNRRPATTARATKLAWGARRVGRP